MHCIKYNTTDSVSDVASLGRTTNGNSLAAAVRVGKQRESSEWATTENLVSRTLDNSLLSTDP
jgi:hypothetical protein